MNDPTGGSSRGRPFFCIIPQIKVYLQETFLKNETIWQSTFVICAGMNTTRRSVIRMAALQPVLLLKNFPPIGCARFAAPEKVISLLNKPMWKVGCLVLLVLAAFSCRKAAPAPDPDPMIETGDLLFVGIPMNYMEDSMSQAIADATAAGDTINFIHTAILEVDKEGAIWVIDATLAYGVDRHPLDTMLKQFTLHRDGAAGTFEVMRLVDNSNAARYVAQAKTWLAESYDQSFLPENGKHYCTELVYDAYVDSDGNHRFEQVPMNFKNKEGEMPAYWTWLFSELGEPVPQGVPGTNPQQMHASPALEHVMYLENPYQE